MYNQRYMSKQVKNTGQQGSPQCTKIIKTYGTP